MSIPTQYRQRQAEAAHYKRLVMLALAWDELSYAQFQYQQGCSYLQYYIPNDPAGIDMLVSDRLFWAWWKNRWTDRDRDFLAFTHEQSGDIVSDYKQHHDSQELARAIRPSAVVLSASYAQMMGELIDSKIKS